jgi:hypothetical protein
VICGTIVHPQGLAAQMPGGTVMGFGLAATERHVYDPAHGRPAARGLYQAKLKSYLDIPAEIAWDAVGQPNGQNPIGAKGIGEPIEGAASSALICAISDVQGLPEMLPAGDDVREVQADLVGRGTSLPAAKYDAYQKGYHSATCERIKA